MLLRNRKLVKRLRFGLPARAGALAGLIVLAVMGVATFAVKARVWAVADESRSPATESSNALRTAPNNFSGTTPPVVAQQVKELIGSEVLTITRFGFEPAEITRPAGKFFLMVENRSKQNPITVRLESDRGKKIIEVVQPEDQLDWARELNAPPGRYVLTVADHPEWVCRITITER